MEGDSKGDFEVMVHMDVEGDIVLEQVLGGSRSRFIAKEPSDALRLAAIDAVGALPLASVIGESYTSRLCRRLSITTCTSALPPATEYSIRA